MRGMSCMSCMCCMRCMYCIRCVRCTRCMYCMYCMRCMRCMRGMRCSCCMYCTGCMCCIPGTVYVLDVPYALSGYCALLRLLRLSRSSYDLRVAYAVYMRCMRPVLEPANLIFPYCAACAAYDLFALLSCADFAPSRLNSMSTYWSKWLACKAKSRPLRAVLSLRCARYEICAVVPSHGMSGLQAVLKGAVPTKGCLNFSNLW